MPKKKRKVSLVGTSLGLGVSSLAIGSLGPSTTVTYGQTALANVGKMLPATGSILGAGLVLKAASQLYPKKRGGKKHALW